MQKAETAVEAEAEAEGNRDRGRAQRRTRRARDWGPGLGRSRRGLGILEFGGSWKLAASSRKTDNSQWDLLSGAHG